MSRRSLLLPILASGLTLAGCRDSGLTDVRLPDSGGGALAAQALTMVPITWRFHNMGAPGGILVCLNSNGSPPSVFVPANWRLEGTLTHLGLIDANASSAVFSNCTVNIVAGVPVTVTSQGSIHVVGANGDALFVAGVQTLEVATLNATGEWTITGGTGRFEGASGWLSTSDVPADDWVSAFGRVGSGSGMITPPGMLGH